MPLESKIEAVLFYRAEPVTKKELGKLFDVDEATVMEAVNTLQERYKLGLRVLVTGDEVTLTTAPEQSELIESLRKEDLKRDIGKAGAETLAIILYREPVTRAEIDVVRGVNSAFILRNLLIRGLIKRVPHPTDKRQYQYASTTDLLAHLGISKKEELPQFQEIADELDTYENEQTDESNNEKDET